MTYIILNESARNLEVCVFSRFKLVLVKDVAKHAAEQQQAEQYDNVNQIIHSSKD